MQLNWTSSVIYKLLDNRVTRPIKHSIVRSLAVSAGPRAVLNLYYNLLSDEAKYRFQGRYAKMFRAHDSVALASGDWLVHFLDRDIRLPIRPSWSWLDWDVALSITGHDIEVKQTYAALINSPERPTLFLDVGANYGTHSVLFLSAGVPTIAFEPNRECFAYFQAVCQMNGLKGRWEQVAVGNKAGHIKLFYPTTETYLGSVSADVVSHMASSHKLLVEQVPIKRLDDYVLNCAQGETLIKIDVEGYENEVIQGASRLLKNYRPKIIFESIDAKARKQSYQLLADSGYRIYSLPWHPSATVAHLRIGDFVISEASNFIAIPR